MAKVTEHNNMGWHIKCQAPRTLFSANYGVARGLLYLLQSAYVEHDTLLIPLCFHICKYVLFVSIDQSIIGSY